MGESKKDLRAEIDALNAELTKAKLGERGARAYAAQVDRTLRDIRAGAQVHRVNGLARIDYPSGGVIIFRSLRARGVLRGHALDYIYADTGVDVGIEEWREWRPRSPRPHAPMWGSSVRRAFLAALVVTALWLAPLWMTGPVRAEPDARSQVERAFGLTPEAAPEFAGDWML